MALVLEHGGRWTPEPLLAVRLATEGSCRRSGHRVRTRRSMNARADAGRQAGCPWSSCRRSGHRARTRRSVNARAYAIPSYLRLTSRNRSASQRPEEPNDEKSGSPATAIYQQVSGDHGPMSSQLGRGAAADALFGTSWASSSARGGLPVRSSAASCPGSVPKRRPCAPFERIPRGSHETLPTEGRPKLFKQASLRSVSYADWNSAAAEPRRSERALR